MSLLVSARHARRRAHRLSRARLAGPAAAASILAVLASVVTSAPPVLAAPAPTDPCGGAYAPILRDAAVSQGTGTQTPLVRGKSTVVRLFLSAPQCAPAGTVQLVAASIKAFEGTQALTGDVPTTPGALGPAYPTFEALDLPIAPESPANPTFLLPRFGAGSSTVGQFGATFRATVTYQYRSSPDRVETATQVYERLSASGQPIATAVAPRSNALRVLLVPMGNGGGVAGAPPASQFPMRSNGGAAVNGQYADQTVQRGMETLARLMPLPDGVGDLTDTTAGLRYRLDTSGMLDLSRLATPDGAPVLDAGSFCGTSFTSIPVYGALASYLAAWNKNNSAAQADIVVGVVWQATSKGTADGCAEGFANIKGNQAWVRTFADTTSPTGVLDARASGVSMTGPLLGMEISHTFGGVSPLDTNRHLTAHSKNFAADPSHALATVDSRVGKFLAGPLSVMRYSGSSSGYTAPAGEPNPWNNDSTLFEVEDFRFNQCALTPGMTTAQCPFNGGVIGKIGSAPAGEAFSLSGSVLGSETDVAFASYLASDLETSSPDDVGDYVLVQRDAVGQVIPGPLGTQRLPVRFVRSLHGSSVTDSGLVGSLSAAMPAAPGVVHFEIWRGEPGALCTAGSRPAGCLYARSAGAAPVVTAVSGTSTLTEPQSVSGSAGDETDISVAPSGRAVAWTAVAAGAATPQIVLRAVSATGVADGPAVPTGIVGQDPAWSADGTRLAFATPDGDLRVADVQDVNGDARPDALGAPRTVYRRALQVPPPVGSAAARAPTFSPSGTELAAEINGSIWRLDARERSTLEQIQCDLATFRLTAGCELLARAGAAPSWRSSIRPGVPALIAYQAEDGIRTLDPAVRPALAALEYASVLRLPGATQPAWGDQLLAYTDGRGVLVADTRDEAPDGSWFSAARVTALGDDRRPWLTSDDRFVGFDRATPATGRDVFLGRRTDSGSGLRFEVGTEQDPGLLRSDVLLDCGNGFDPVAVTLRPTSVDEDAATFEIAFSDVGGCPGGTLYARVNDGFRSSALTPLRRIPSDPGIVPPVAPSPAIGSPSAGTTLQQYDAVIATGSSILPVGTNAEDLTAEWRLTGPAGSGIVDQLVGTDPRTLSLDPSVPGGRTPGRYTLRLSVTSGGTTGTTSTHFFVLPDPEHDGRALDVSFDPQTLFVPSSGNDVTVTVSSALDLRAVTSAGARLVELGNRPSSLVAKSWSRNKDGTYTAKFDRQQLTCELAGAGLSSGYARVVLAVSAPGLLARGLDPRHPVLTPTSPPATC